MSVNIDKELAFFAARRRRLERVALFVSFAVIVVGLVIFFLLLRVVLPCSTVNAVDENGHAVVLHVCVGRAWVSP